MQLHQIKFGKKQIGQEQVQLLINAILTSVNIKHAIQERRAEKQCYTNDLHDAFISKSGVSF